MTLLRRGRILPRCLTIFGLALLISSTMPVAANTLTTRTIILIPNLLSSQPVGMTIMLVPSLPSNQPVGTTILWTALVRGTGRPITSFRYRFRTSIVNGPPMIRRDFDVRNTFRWTPLDEGTYNVAVSVQDPTSGAILDKVATYAIRSRVTGTRPIVTPTSNPLVALYSAPPCVSGKIRALFRALGDATWKYTNWKPCQPAKSVNFYLAGMRAATVYTLRHQSVSGSVITNSPLFSYKTGTPDLVFPSFNVINPVDTTTSNLDNMILHSLVLTQRGLSYPVATDLFGRVIWYYEPEKSGTAYFGPFLTGPVAGGTMLVHLSDLRSDGLAEQVLREIDLAGNPVRETSVDRVNEQLVARGQDRITAFTHDTLRLPNDYTVVLGYVERVLTNVQGPGAVDVLGDMTIVLNQDFQVVWTWNTFDHLNVKRQATLGEKCNLGTIGCPLLQRATSANDWTHSNTIAYSPADGNLLLSMRNQDMVVKIDYRNGAGTGNILWRLGKDGDFTLPSSDAYPWFSHQHDVHYDGSQLILFDNGNVRCQNQGTACHSRGQVLNINEQTRTATLALNADLGLYAQAFGSGDRLSNGDFQFMVGTFGLTPASRSLEVRPNGSINYVLQAGGISYRSFRMQNLDMP